MYEWGRNGGFTGTLVDNEASGSNPAFVFDIATWGGSFGAQEFNATGRGDAAQMKDVLGDEYGSGFFNGKFMPDRIGDKAPLPNHITDAAAVGTITLQNHTGRTISFTAKLSSVSINPNPEGGWIVQGKWKKQSVRTSSWSDPA
jgi:hypothetical protein